MMVLERTVLNGVSQSDKDMPHGFAYMWKLNNKINNDDNKSGNKLIDTGGILRGTR